MKKEVIMIDMDDVITSGGFLYLINKFLDTNYKEEDFKEYYMQDIIPNKTEFFEWFKTQNMYDNATLLPSAYEVIKELNNHYEVYIGTAFLFKEIKNESGFILNQKFEFLKKNLPFIKPEQYIFINNKSLLKVDIKIDDRIENLDGVKKKILFTAYHNANISNDELNKKDIKRVKSWQEIKRILLN